MQVFHYVADRLQVEDVLLSEVAARYGTPVYVYSRALIERNWTAYDEAFGAREHTICFAVKANSNLAILGLLARMGSGFDIVSGGELERVLQAGGDPAKIVFSGVGKTVEEMRAALKAGIKCFNIESEAEIHALDAVAGAMGVTAPISLRVNPDVDAGTHPYISTGLKENKFGIEYDRAAAVYRLAASMPHLRVTGIDCHIGSQITTLAPYEDALGRIASLVAELRSAGIPLQHVDIGGGLGISYRDEVPPAPADLIDIACRTFNDPQLELLVEPGRSIVGNAGVLLTRVLYMKQGADRNFVIVDGAMNDLIRPVLYDAWQEILPVERHMQRESLTCDVVGPICETGDFLGKGRQLAVYAGDLLAVLGVGAYGFAMSSNYNSRPRAAEILVDHDRMHEIRHRETYEDLYRGESLLP